jgi:hypothetical protein
MTARTTTRNASRVAVAAGLCALLLMQASAALLAQARAARRGGAVQTEEGGAAVSRRGAAVKTDEGSAAVTRRGAAVKTEEGVQTVHRGYAAPAARGGVAVGEEGAVAVGRRGAVVVGEEGAARAGRYHYSGGVAVYEDNDAWKTAAGIAAGVAGGIAIGTLLSKPPAQAAPVTVTNNTYYYDSGAFYTKAMHEGEVVYQVVEPPVGAVVPALPAGCTSVNKGGAAYSQCGTTYYQKVSSGYQVAKLQ